MEKLKIEIVLTNMNKLLIYIVSYQRKEYTQGNIISISKIKPKNSQIIVCDNGSIDGTKEWLEENQEKYELGLIFPEENLRVGGAWTLLTNYLEPTEFDYILLLDVIEHLKNPENFMIKLKKKIDKNSKVQVIISTPNIGFLIIRLMLLFGSFNYGKRGILVKTHISFLTF